MDPVSATIITKGVLAVLLIGGGIFALLGGMKLYRDGTGRGKDKVEIEAFGMKANAATIGSAVMVTAVAWAWMGYMVSPSYSQTGDTVQVYSFETQTGEVTSRALAARARTASVGSDPEALKGLFVSAVQSSERRDHGAVVALDGVPASLDLKSLTTSQVGSGVQVMANFNTGEQTAAMVYTSQVENGKVTFVPSKTTRTYDSTQPVHDEQHR